MRSSNGCISPMRGACGVTWSRGQSNGHWAYRSSLTLPATKEIAHRQQTRLARLMRRAHFPFLKTNQGFQFHLSIVVAGPHARLGARARLRDRRPLTDSAGQALAAEKRIWRSPWRTGRFRTASMRFHHGGGAHRRRLRCVSRRRVRKYVGTVHPSFGMFGARVSSSVDPTTPTAGLSSPNAR